MKNIVVPVDFSAGTQRIVRRAIEQARAFHAKLWLIHVAAPEPDFVPYASDPPPLRDQVAKSLREEHRLLQALAETIEAEGVEVTALMVQGPTVEKILQEAQKLEADLIVVGSHGHGMLHRALLGSVSAGLIRHADVPVLIVPVREA